MPTLIPVRDNACVGKRYFNPLSDKRRIFFMSFFITELADGSQKFTMAGYTALIILAIVILLIGNAIFGKRKKFDATCMAFSAMALALATVASLITLFKMPQGGSVTLFSMLFICVIGYWYGLGTGLTTAIAYGLLQLLINPYVLNIPQLLLDYVFAFGALGLTGLFAKKDGKYSFIIAYLVAITGRFVFAFLSGVIFFGDFASWMGLSNSIAYSVAYNGSYIFTEGALTMIVLLIPGVSKGLNHVKRMALKENR